MAKVRYNSQNARLTMLALRNGDMGFSKGDAYFIPRHCLGPAPKALTNFSFCFDSEVSQRSGQKRWESGKISSSWWRE